MEQLCENIYPKHRIQQEKQEALSKLRNIFQIHVHSKGNSLCLVITLMGS